AVEPQALISRKSPRRFKPNFEPVSRPRGKHPAMSNQRGCAMLAEIFMLRLETAARVVKFEAATPSRFVPITLPAAKTSYSPRRPQRDCVAPVPATRFLS